MKKYRKKPVIVEAEVYKIGLEDGFTLFWSDVHGEYQQNFKKLENALSFAEKLPNKGYDEDLIIEDPRPFIKTLEGNHLISKGDYIVTGIKGERYPVKPDIFHATYELVED